MRKIEQQMLEALRERRDWQAGNTAVIFSDHNGNPYLDATVYLHGNPIAELLTNGELESNVQVVNRWPTRTTASRLRALGFEAYHRDYRIYFSRLSAGIPEV